MATAATTLDSVFWNALAICFVSSDYEYIGTYMQAHVNDLDAYTKIMYGELPLFDYLDDLNPPAIASTTFTIIGESFARIYDAIMAKYNPLENFFTEGEFQDKINGKTTKSGKMTVTPSGTINVGQTGSKDTEIKDGTNIQKGTTYDNVSDFLNISENISNGTVTETYNNMGTQTSYTNYKTETEYNNLSETNSGGKITTESKAGNSGIFSKQDLTQREINLRLKNSAYPILVRMVVDLYNKGVWQS